MKTFKLLAAAITATLALSAHAGHNFQNPNDNKMTCKVVGVLDGDTLDCYEGQGKKHRIRLAEIDAPEKSQAYGQKAKKMLSDLTFGKVVTVTYHQQDRYGRIIGEVFAYGGGYSVNYQLVKNGMAWAYERYNNDRAYITAQQDAKAKKLGLWRDNNPINPEDYRHKNN